MHTLAITAPSPAETKPSAKRAPRPAAAVAAVLDRTDGELDHLVAKLAFDSLIDPSLDVEAARSDVERLAHEARAMASATNAARLSALRTLLYEAGPWNGGRPCGYDHSDPLGTDIANKLLANYLRTRRGNCISMPILFLVLAERLDLDVALALAPLHVFLHHRDEYGRVVNIEATSGGHPARTEWLRQNFRVSEREIATGIYLRSLSRREAIAHMATTVVEHLIGTGRCREALAVSEIILRHSPRDVHAMAKQGHACAMLIETEFTRKYPAPSLIPPLLRGRYLALCARNRAAFEAAEALGWEAPQ